MKRGSATVSVHNLLLEVKDRWLLISTDRYNESPKAERFLISSVLAVIMDLPLPKNLTAQYFSYKICMVKKKKEKEKHLRSCVSDNF